MEPPPPHRATVVSPAATRATRKLSRARPPSASPPPESSASAGTAEAGSSNTADTTGKKPAKRARKAINCEPCRINKLKCDRNRPCSSCELRGTVSQCYQDARKQDVRVGQGPDPLTELNKIRKSLTSLENFIRYSNGLLSPELIEDSSPELVAEATNLAATILGSASRLNGTPLPESSAGKTGPGSRGRQAGGLYAGPTSTSSHLLSIDADDIDTPPTPSSMLPGEYDADVLRALPETHIVDALIDYYFAHCQWIYRHVWESSFRAQWTEYKAGRSTERLVLATCCGILALTIAYMPDVHTLKLSTIAKLGARPGEKLFALMQTTLTRYETDHGAGGGYSLEYAELLLLRGHYLLFATQGGEEIWAAKSRMMSVATAMGLHRDPSQWRMSPEVAERRRWIWWYILSFERWQSFLLGRPPSIANHHFDTQIPKSHDPHANAALQMFGLAEIIGGIIDDALSLRPVSYSNVRKHDRALVRWFDNLPPEWTMTETQISNGLRSENMSVRRLTVQVVCIIAAYYHVRFTLHRPYAARPPTPTGVGLGFGGSVASGSGMPGPGGETKLESTESSEIAASSAEHLIRLSLRCRREPGSAPERVFATDGHLAFHPFHVFSAAMFFSFQLIAAPNGPRAAQCKENIVRAQNAFRAMPTDTPGGRLAANGTTILDELTPLWGDAFVRMAPGPEKETLKSQVLTKVRRLTFPFHDPEAAAAEGSAQGLSQDFTPNPTGMPGTVITNSGRIAHAPNNHAHAASTRPTAVAFGNSGTLMPDMSVSGRTPVMSASTWNYEPRRNSMDTAFAPLPMSETDASRTTWNQPLGGPPQTSMAGHVSASASGPSQETWMRPSSSTHSHYYPPAPVPGSSSMPPPPPPPQAHGPPPLSISPQVYDPESHAFAAPPSTGAYAQGVSVGGVSQEMPWGAGIGIDAGEWAGFMQTMAVPPMNSAGGHPPPHAATGQHQHMYGYAPQSTMSHPGHARSASRMDETL